jgi:hypothetical protein
LVTGSACPKADHTEAELLREHYRIYLGLDDLKSVGMDELLDAIDASCPVSRLKHRRGASNLNSLSDKPFIRIHKTNVHSVAFDTDDKRCNPRIGFKHSSYSVSEGIGTATLVI